MRLIATGIASLFATAAFIGTPPAAQAEQDRVLFLNSYHQGYTWSDDILEGIETVLEDADVELKVHYMDTKRNTSDDYMNKAGRTAKKVIESYGPDVVIACDDNASQYVVQPYYKNADLPFVFCGVNWEADSYGYPYDNVTGMVEVDGIKGLVHLMKRITDSTDDIGFIGSDTNTNHKVEKNLERVLGQDLKARYAKDFESFKTEFTALQDDTDFIIFYLFSGIKGWSEEAGTRFMADATQVPTATFQAGVIPYVTMGYLKVAQEQGRWSAKQALKILDGTKPAEIEITRNKEGELVLNSAMAEAAGIDVPYSFIELTDRVVNKN